MTNEKPNKQYILVIDELYTGMMNLLMPHIKFVEVQGMNMTDNQNFQLLVTPAQKPEEPAIEEKVNDPE